MILPRLRVVSGTVVAVAALSLFFHVSVCTAAVST